MKTERTIQEAFANPYEVMTAKACAELIKPDLQAIANRDAFEATFPKATDEEKRENEEHKLDSEDWGREYNDDYED